jgi:hypothetical protein
MPKNHARLSLLKVRRVKTKTGSACRGKHEVMYTRKDPRIPQ